MSDDDERRSSRGPAVPAAQTDRVAERALICCRIILQRCPTQQPDLVHKLLQRIAPAAALPRDSASEEVRHAAQQCLEALFGGLGSPKAELQAFWSTEAGIQDLAYVTQLLLAAANAEAMAGHTGSKAVRVTALTAVCNVLEAVNDAQPLSYLLPGLVGGLSKAILAGAAKMTQERAAQSGAAASSAALAQAVRGITLLLCATLNDGDTPPGSAAAQSRRREPQSASSSAEALSALEALAVGQAAESVQPAPAEEVVAQALGTLGKYKVNRDTAWVDATLQRLAPLLERVLPPLCSHPQPAVREALAKGVCEVLTQCQLTLAPCSEMLLGIVLALAADQWAQVAQPCRAFLGGNPAASQTASVTAIISKLTLGLNDAARGSEDAFLLHARRLSTAIQVLPAGDVAAKLLQSPAQLSLLCSSLQQCFAFDQAAAGLLLYAGAEPAPHLSIPAAQPEGASMGDSHSSSKLESGKNEAKAAAIQSREQSAPAKQAAIAQESLSAPMLPRMPAGLAHVGSQQCYEALAAVARSIGHVALTAGRSTLRGLVDALLSNLRRAQRFSKDKAVGRGSASKRPAEDWQLQAASVAVVTTEVLFGASPAWQPGPQPAVGAGEQSTADDKQQQEELEALAILIQEEWVREPLWGVPTSEEPSWRQDDSKAQCLSPQVLGENALLARVLLEGVGAFARALGGRYPASGRLMYTVLIPLLERLANPCPSVSAAAAVAIGSLCVHSSYASFDELVRGNADYIVDGLCRQLRHLEDHPRAPALFAALLRRAGVAPALLPLLVEPARAAVQGLGILARRRHPGHSAAFLASLREICAGTSCDAQLMRQDVEHAAAALEERSQAQRAAYQTSTAHSSASGRDADAEEIRSYFMEHLQSKEDSAQGGAEEAPDPEDLAAQVEWDCEAWAAADERRRRVHADATLAASAAHMAGPLVTSKHLQVALLAMEVAEAALRTLACTSAALDIQEQRITPLVKPRDAVQPVQPEVPQLLPSIHTLWAPLVQTLKDERIAAVEAALGFLGSYTELGGSFLARRFRQEAWPQLQRLLQRGPDTPLNAPEPLAPAVVHRAQLAVVTYLQRVASDGDGAAVLAPIAAAVAEAVAPHLAAAYPASLRAATSQLLLSLAKLDADALWLLLFRLAQQESPANPCPRLLPSMQEIKPPQAKSGQTAARDVRAVAGKLLGQVSAIEPAWHARATLQQPSCI
ncbi:g350 [Coccomyxa viridis]|uniref:G350 protein n=1 Tax=Coccomyxa viridis TaxID=1274662 RepID=A0ABP1FKU4_9CHLO